jgi:hypothetical protein
VTHPFHPLLGQRFELVDQRHTWGAERVYYYEDQARLRSMPAAWTSVGVADPYVAISAGRSYFHIADLVELSRALRGRER